jgi:hypothetical protein
MVEGLPRIDMTARGRLKMAEIVVRCEELEVRGGSPAT